MTDALDTAQLVSVRCIRPNPTKLSHFFYDMLGMEISHREGQSVYLRAYEDFYQYTLKITEREPAGPGGDHLAGEIRRGAGARGPGD